MGAGRQYLLALAVELTIVSAVRAESFGNRALEPSGHRVGPGKVRPHHLSSARIFLLVGSFTRRELYY